MFKNYNYVEKDGEKWRGFAAVLSKRQYRFLAEREPFE